MANGTAPAINKFAAPEPKFLKNDPFPIPPSERRRKNIIQTKVNLSAQSFVGYNIKCKTRTIANIAKSIMQGIAEVKLANIATEFLKVIVAIKSTGSSGVKSSKTIRIKQAVNKTVANPKS